NADTSDPTFLQAIANTAGFHFPTIEQGGNSLYPSLAQRATHEETIRILISIGPTETMHFQTWSDNAGNAPPLTNVIDPVTGVSVTFPDLSDGGELLQKNLIMPEPCPFLSRRFPRCSIIRPTKTEGVAMGALTFLTNMGLFIGQSPAFFAYMTNLARHRWLSGLPSDASHYFHAQDQLHRYACPEGGDLRNSGQFGVVAKNSTALSLHSIPGARCRSQRCGDGSAALGHSDLMDLGTN